ncbi:TRAP transporter large permease [Pikeienuella piscinae]|uniref:TRAP transporter large permease protein n=1 Tax=Pikeienuella piscinae TaxID=2748098 RepID=A0A7L5BWI5_9RHOB|nr:TRAP transporter large permease [Pikeienuella piscinae]QIE56770.1 TRAP transporter large permease [Pikeienuella piscinae]
MLGVSIVVLLALLALSVPVAAALFILGVTLDWGYSPAPLINALGSQLWSTSTSFILVAIPLFIMIGEILQRSGIAAKVYDALDAWLSWMPGGLMHANIGTATFFSATSGSSVATAATVATIGMPQARRLGYDERFFAGSIAAGGTLGILIPPSINLIVYGFLARTSIPQLFLAGIVPGVLMALLFMIIIAALCAWKPHWGGGRRSATMSERLSKLRHLGPILLLFAFIIGSIYAGWATPTEAAAIGVIAALVMAWAAGGLSWRMIFETLEGTMRTTVMIMLILIAANFLNFVLASVGLTDRLLEVITELDLGPMQTLMLLIAFYIVLGFFVETLSLMIVTIPIVIPIVSGLGFDLVWFGILLIVLIEMALITPPIGLNLYVVQGVRDRGSLNEVIVGVIPFAVAMLLMIVALLLFPGLALFLPGFAEG